MCRGETKAKEIKETKGAVCFVSIFFFEHAHENTAHQKKKKKRGEEKHDFLLIHL